MALFTDGSISTIDDLAAYDSAVLDVAGSEGIDLTRKLSLAQDELGVILSTLLPQEDNCSLENVVVTAPLRLWHTLRSLTLVYEDAYFSQLNDRYRGKRDAFAERARWAQEQLMQAGAGFVADAIPQAQPPLLTAVPIQQAAATYYVTVTWANSSQAEGAPAELRSLAAEEGTSLQVQPSAPPANAVGWNVYVGLTPEGMQLQNETVLPLNASWVLDKPAPASGRLPGTGQPPDFLRALPRILQRG